jgi:hypothetical protein
MVSLHSKLFLLVLLFILGACASKMKNQMHEYRDVYARGDYVKAEELLNKSELKKEKRSQLLLNLEEGTVSLAQDKFDQAIGYFERSLALIDELYTTKLSSKAASFLINDASDVFYGASYERSYAYYFLAKAYYGRYLKSQNKLDLQGARGTILAWDTYFTQLQRSASAKTLYHTDLMMKIFGGEIHEVSDIKNDKQISLQLYKDAYKILQIEGGLFGLFNSKSIDYIKAYEKALKEGDGPPTTSYEYTSAYKDLKNFLQYKILAITKEIRGFEFNAQVKELKADPEIVKKAQAPKSNVVIVLEEGLIPPKVGKPFNFGIKGAANAVENPTAKNFILTVGGDALAYFAMEKLGMYPTETAGAGNFIFGYQATRLAVQEAAIEFELPMIENVPLVSRQEVFILNDKGEMITHAPLPIVSDNGDIARIVLEEDVVARYVKTGTRVAVKHIVAIVAAMQIYNQLSGRGGDLIAKTAAMGAYVGASKGIAMFEKADTRHWTTLPQALRLSEFKLPEGQYQVAVGNYSGEVAPKEHGKILGSIQVNKSEKSIFTLKFNP